MAKAAAAKKTPAPAPAPKKRPAPAPKAPPTREKLLSMSWPNASEAEKALKKMKVDYSALGLVLAPADDQGYCLLPTEAGDKAPTSLPDGGIEGDGEETQGVEEGPSSEEVEGDKSTPEEEAALEDCGQDDGEAGASYVVDEEEEAPAPILQRRPVTAPQGPKPGEGVMIRFPTLMTKEAALVWASFYGPRARNVIEIVDEAGEVLETLDFTSSKPVTKEDGERQLLPRATTGRRTGVNSPYAQHREPGSKLALRPQGVLRSELNKLNGGTPLNWKAMLDGYARLHKLSVRTDKTDQGPRYFLVKE